MDSYLALFKVLAISVFSICIYGFDPLSIFHWQNVHRKYKKKKDKTHKNDDDNEDEGGAHKRIRIRIRRTPAAEAGVRSVRVVGNTSMFAPQPDYFGGLVLGAAVICALSSWVGFEYYLRYRVIRCLQNGAAISKVQLGKARVDPTSLLAAAVVAAPAAITVYTMRNDRSARGLHRYARAFQAYHATMLVAKILISVMLWAIVKGKTLPKPLTNLQCVDKLKQVSKLDDSWLRYYFTMFG